MPLDPTITTLNAIDRATLRFFLGIAYESMPESTFEAFGELLKKTYHELSVGVCFGGDNVEELYHRDPARVAGYRDVAVVITPEAA